MNSRHEKNVDSFQRVLKKGGKKRQHIGTRVHKMEERDRLVFLALDYTHGSIYPKQKNARILVIFYENTATIPADMVVQDTTDISAIITAVPLEREAAMVSCRTMTPILDKHLSSA